MPIPTLPLVSKCILEGLSLLFLIDNSPSTSVFPIVQFCKFVSSNLIAGIRLFKVNCLVGLVVPIPTRLLLSTTNVLLPAPASIMKG